MDRFMTQVMASFVSLSATAGAMGAAASQVDAGVVGATPVGAQVKQQVAVPQHLKTKLGDSYAWSQSLGKRLANKVTGLDLNASWSEDGRWLWYQTAWTEVEVNGQTQVLKGGVKVDTQTGFIQPAFDAEAVAKALAEVLKKPVFADDLPVLSMHVGDGGVVDLLVDGAPGVFFRVDGQEVEQAELAPEHAFCSQLLPVDPRRRGRGRGGHTSIVVVNHSPYPLQLLWIDSPERVLPYGIIEPGASRTQHSIVGHAWRVRQLDEVDETSDGKTKLAGEDWGDLVAEESAVVAVVVGKAKQPDGEQARAGRRASRWDWRRGPGGRLGGPGDRFGGPDSRIVVQDHNVYWRKPNAATAAQDSAEHEGAQNGQTDLIPMTTEGNEHAGYGRWVELSPNEDAAVVYFTEKGQDRQISIVESSPRDQLQPKLHTLNYAKPGDVLDVTKPHLFDLVNGQQIQIDDALFDNPWQISGGHWSKDGQTYYFLYNQRGHQVMRLLAVDIQTGDVRVVIDEPIQTFFDYSSKQYLYYFDEDEPGQARAIWMSERSGYNHLYLVDLQTGDIQPITTQVPGGINAKAGQWVVREVVKVDEAAGVVTFKALGLDADQDPYLVHYATIKLDGTGFTRLTEGNGTHTLKASPTGDFYIDTYSRVDMPPVFELRESGTGRLVCELAQADASALEKQMAGGLPEPFVAKGRDGKTDIWGVIYKPTNFDPNQQYPVIESIYAGPHGQHVPKGFSTPSGGSQAVAEMGYIVVQIDGMGTNWRSKAFHDVCWKNLKDAGFLDRIAWIKQAAQKYPQMDITRVGIFGSSAGGQNAMRAVLDFADFYDAAFADCGCHDNRMDKVWWNEQWMGYPVDDSYAASSNVEDAHKLGGALLLSVGEMDTNVDPASTMQVVDALIQADQDFDLMVIPGGGHGAGYQSYGRRRMLSFFREHLGGPMPMAD